MTRGSVASSARFQLLWLALLAALSAYGLSSFPSRAQTSSATPAKAPQASKGVRIPIEISTNHVLLLGRVNNSEPLWFTLDTGAAGSVINLKRARELNLQMAGMGRAQGAGGTVQSSIVNGVTFNLQGLEMKNLRVMGLALDSIEATAGRNMDVILGAELFKRYVVEVDYANKLLTLYEPDEFVYEGQGASLPLTFYANHPYVSAKVNIPEVGEVEGEFVIDAGSGFALTFTPSFFNSRKLLDHIPKTLQSKARGVGGEFPLTIGRVDSLEIGGFKLDNPVTAFPQTTGFISKEGSPGNIGGMVLRRFKVIFDYPHRRMILEPNKNLKEPFDFDMSGLALVSETPDYRVIKIDRITDNSPASELGLKAGDLLMEVNGRAANEITLSNLREMFRQEGKQYELKIKRGEEIMKLRLKTRRLI